MSAGERQLSVDATRLVTHSAAPQARERFGVAWVRATDALPIGWAEPLHRYASWLLASGKTTETAYGYARNARALGSHMVGRGIAVPWSVTPSDLELWLVSGVWSRHTRHRLAVAARSFYSWGTQTGLVAWSPAAGLGMGDHRPPGPEPDRLPDAWAKPLHAYAVHLRAGARADNTIKRYLELLGRLAHHAPDPWSVRAEHLELWLSRPDWSPASKRSARAAVRRFYAWAEQTERLDRSPAAVLPTIRVRRAVPRPITTEALLAGLHEADDRLRLVLMLAAFAGLRRAEIAALRWRDFEGGTVVVQGKGDNQRRVPMHPDLASVIAAERARRAAGYGGSGFSGPHLSAAPNAWLFPAAHRLGPITPQHLGKIAAAGLPGGWTLHTLRHRFATQAYAVDRDLRAVQELLGHSKPETTARYAAAPADALLSAVSGVGLGLGVQR